MRSKLSNAASARTFRRSVSNMAHHLPSPMIAQTAAHDSARALSPHEKREGEKEGGACATPRPRRMALAMKVDGKPWRTIWLEPDGWSVGVIDQTRLPHRFETKRLTTVAQAADAIATMVIRGAPLIGVTAAYGMCLALRENASDEALER